MVSPCALEILTSIYSSLLTFQFPGSWRSWIYSRLDGIIITQVTQSISQIIGLYEMEALCAFGLSTDLESNALIWSNKFIIVAVNDAHHVKWTFNLVWIIKETSQNTWILKNHMLFICHWESMKSCPTLSLYLLLGNKIYELMKIVPEVPTVYPSAAHTQFRLIILVIDAFS